jgi:DNA-binding transcriptional regulator YdaS (Cro superfamily)
MNNALTRYEALRLCVTRAGNQEKLAKGLGCTQPTVSRMMQVRQMSHQYVLIAERLYGVPRHALRPDIYPVPVQHPSRIPDGEGARFYGVDQGYAA